MAEIWDILDKDGNLTGRTIERGEELKEGEYHLVVHIWVMNSKKELLIQRRADHIKHAPGIWASTGGSGVSGEDSLTAAIRELSEEMGIKVQKEEMKKINRVIKRNSIADIWLVKKDIDVFDLVLQKEEVSDAKWVSLEELKNMIKNKRFYDYGERYFEMIFNL